MSHKNIKVEGVGGVFFRCESVAETSAWYRDHLGVDVESWGGAVFQWLRAGGAEKGTTTWGLFPRDTSYFAEGQDAMVNFRVADLDLALAGLRERGVHVDDRVEDSEFGRFGWFVDPDGRRVELWQPAPGH